MLRKITTLCTLACLFSGCTKEESTSTPLSKVMVLTPEVLDVPIFKDYVGVAAPKQTVNISPQITGQLTGIHFAQGLEVKEGDLLFSIDARPYEAALAKAEAALARDIATLKLSEETLRRYSKLIKDEYVSKLDYDRFITDVLTNEAAIKVNTASIEQAKIDLDYCSIRAPFSGVISYQMIDVGNIVEQGASTLAILNQIDPLYVDFYIPEQDLLQIRKYSEMRTLSVLASPDYNFINPFQGELSIINNQIDRSTGRLLIRSTFNNAARQLWPGQYLSVRVVLYHMKNALVVPQEALMFGIDGCYLYILNDKNVVEKRKVEVGENLPQDRVVVNTGIEATDRVIVRGQIHVAPGLEASAIPYKKIED